MSETLEARDLPQPISISRTARIVAEVRGRGAGYREFFCLRFGSLGGSWKEHRKWAWGQVSRGTECLVVEVYSVFNLTQLMIPFIVSSTFRFPLSFPFLLPLFPVRFFVMHSFRTAILCLHLHSNRTGLLLAWAIVTLKTKSTSIHLFWCFGLSQIGDSCQFLEGQISTWNDRNMNIWHEEG